MIDLNTIWVTLGVGSIAVPIIIILLLMAGLRVITQYELGVKFTLGKYVGLMQPGLRFVFPIIQKMYRIDMRTMVVDVPNQDCITRDNVTVKVNAVLYYRVNNADKAIMGVVDYRYIVSQLAQTSMRDVVGEASLDELLTKRDQISKRIQTIVDKSTNPWGMIVESVDIKHIELPEVMKRVMARQAEAEREKRAIIIKALGEVEASKNMSKAATKLASTPGALHLRTLHSLNDLSSDESNTIIYAVPNEFLRMLTRIGKK